MNFLLPMISLIIGMTSILVEIAANNILSPFKLLKNEMEKGIPMGKFANIPNALFANGREWPNARL